MYVCARILYTEATMRINGELPENVLAVERHADVCVARLEGIVLADG